jgi:RNA polymerase sigma-70 factor (ECF subfamily)
LPRGATVITSKRPQLIALRGAAPISDRGSVPDLADAADREAVERTLDGDTEAFAGVVRRHGSRLVAICARVVRDRHVGEELAQEALARCYSNLGAWRGDGRFRDWLYRIGMNCCRDYLKAGARAERPAVLTGDELSTARDPESELGGRQLMAALEAEIARLPPAYRESFVLFHGENLAYDEMHAITGVSVGALKVRVHRARLMLRRALGDLLTG